MSLAYSIAVYKGEKMDRVNEFEKEFNYRFKNPDLLFTALSHSSLVNEGYAEISNQRMEFLGDAVLDAIVSDKIYGMYPERDEGFMSKLKSSMVSEQPLYKISRIIGLDKIVMMGKGEMNEHGSHKPSILSDCFEAVVAAVFLDGGFGAAKEWVNSIITEDMYESDKIKAYDYKSLVYEKYAGTGKSVVFKVIKEKGPAHDKEFEVGLFIDGKLVCSTTAANKRTAEQKVSGIYLEKCSEV